jgi:hypothetical protein
MSWRDTLQDSSQDTKDWEDRLKRIKAANKKCPPCGSDGIRLARERATPPPPKCPCKDKCSCKGKCSCFKKGIPTEVSDPSGRVTATKDMEEGETIDFLSYRSWAWQNAKARKLHDLSGRGADDAKHLSYIDAHPQRKMWIERWNAEFGHELNVIYEV